MAGGECVSFSLKESCSKVSILIESTKMEPKDLLACVERATLNNKYTARKTRPAVRRFGRDVTDRAHPYPVMVEDVDRTSQKKEE